ncbi:hypothetical protein Cpir12675_004191 [Ceratocystis pirilliformis]|uniref:PNPLA domain-containing protein n=1 Tax=Ceratocystis pirilliformis TaxID=259994 RepID=A0ABR3YY25_9PEZI
MDSSMTLANGPPKKVLSIDGGGIRGLSNLLILEKIMEGIQQEENLPGVPKPCDRFDLMGGTGTGGMNVDESIKAYKKLSETGFCQERTISKRAVLAVTKNDVVTLPTIFTTYPPLTTILSQCSVWEIARATSAAIAFFKPIKLGRDDIEFVDEVFGNNNPCETLIKEAEKLFPLNRIIALSLGTGLGGVVQINDLQISITSAFEKMASSSKATHHRLKDRYGGTKDYHRLDVISGLIDVTLLDSSALSKIAGLTESYLNENGELVTDCVKALATNGITRPLLRINVVIELILTW